MSVWGKSKSSIGGIFLGGRTPTTTTTKKLDVWKKKFSFFRLLHIFGCVFDYNEDKTITATTNNNNDDVDEKTRK
ncbi:hypothetical protein DERP_007568 [Dermatophagoides pteronyssinus]|uniref:Uncharacterized protein n=1 Tax=Dermatophagoides pteronyssinus TaxID=6956 RepID=A0ABQ8JK45_DERPT|nr:hypothetical protein DERP_007568 [Dermatophagoides pteronyssinus]